MLIHNYGLFWKEDDVFWGTPNNTGTLLGVPSKNITQAPVDFREQSAIYILYADYEIVYVGQTKKKKLFGRLKDHRKDQLAGRWNQFSWFGTRRVLNKGELSSEKGQTHSGHDEVLDHIEAILIHVAEPQHNRQGGKFGPKVEQYIQHRDKYNLGPTPEDMLYEIWENSKTSQ